MRVEGSSKDIMPVEVEHRAEAEQLDQRLQLDRVTQMARQLLGGAEGASTRRRAFSTDQRLTGALKASPQSQRQMIRESTDAATIGQPFSHGVEQRIRLHQRLRSEATQAMFREVGAFQGTGLRCVVLPALIQVGRGSVQTPAAHTCPVPAVMLMLPESDSQVTDGICLDRGGESPSRMVLECLRIDQVMALVRASRGQPQIDAWGLPDSEMTQDNWELLEGWLREGILLQGATARLGAMTIEVPKVANEFDSEIERTERAVIEEALNSVVMRGSAWRDTASQISMQLHQAADGALQRALQALELGDQIRSLVESGCDDPESWDAAIHTLRQQPRAPLWRSVLDSAVALRERLQSPGKRRAVQTAATGLTFYHQRKSEVAGLALQAFRSPGTVRAVLGLQKTPSPGTVAGELGDAYAAVRLRRRSRFAADGKNSPATVLSFVHEDEDAAPEGEPPLKRACQRSQAPPLMQTETL